MWGKRPVSILYWNSYLVPRPVRIKQKNCIIHGLAPWWFLLFYSPKPWSQVWILIYRNWSIFQAYQFKVPVCLKALLFVNFRPFFLKFNKYNVARISLAIKKRRHVLSWSPIVQDFFENFWMIFRMFLTYENGKGMFKILIKMENIGFWVL